MENKDTVPEEKQENPDQGPEQPTLEQEPEQASGQAQEETPIEETPASIAEKIESEPPKPYDPDAVYHYISYLLIEGRESVAGGYAIVDIDPIEYIMTRNGIDNKNRIIMFIKSATKGDFEKFEKIIN